jgi:hypothetical protein
MYGRVVVNDDVMADINRARLGPQDDAGSDLYIVSYEEVFRLFDNRLGRDFTVSTDAQYLPPQNGYSGKSLSFRM